VSDSVEQPSFERCIPAGDNRERSVCTRCGFVHYENPVIVVGVVCTWEGRYMLCRRAIEPRDGFWTMPAGYLEQDETPLEGAKRETREEARTEVDVDAMLAVYAIPPISQVQIIYRGTLRDGVFAPGEESREVRLFDWDDIPWDDLAFPSVHWALKHHREADGRDVFSPFSSPFDAHDTGERSDS